MKSLARGGPVAAPGDRVVYRPLPSRIGAGVYAAFAIWWSVEALLTRGGAGLAPAGWLLAAGALVYGLFWRPAVVVDGAGATLQNVLRDVHVPWPALEQVETRFALTLHAGERRYQSWAAAAPGRPVGVRQLAGGTAPAQDPARLLGSAATTPAASSSRALSADSGAAAFVVEHRWAMWRRAHPAEARESEQRALGRPAAAAPPVRVGWNWTVPAVALAGALLGLLSG